MNQAFLDTSGFMATAVAGGTFKSICTIQQPSGNLTPAGAPDGTYVDVAGLVDIVCQAAPTSVGGIRAAEQKSMAEILSMNELHVLLDNYYGDVVITGTNGVTYFGPQPQMRAVIDGTPFDIVGVESDSQHTQTRMEVKKAGI